MRLVRSASLLVLAVAAAPAAASLDASLANGDRVTGVLDGDADVETFRCAVPRGAKVKVQAKVAKGAAPVRLRADLDAGKALHVEATSKNARVAGVADVSDRLVITVSGTAAAATAYTLTVSWSSPKSVRSTIGVTPGETTAVPVPCDRAARITATVAKLKGSAAAPVLSQFVEDSGAVTELGGSSRAVVTAGEPGEPEFRATDAGATGGGASFRAVVRPPKSLRRRLDLRDAALQTGVGGLSAGFAGRDGGSITADLGSSIEGAAIDVPPGALGLPSAVLLGVAPEVVPPGSATLLAAVGPAVFFGPEGLTFASPVTITLPYDPGLVTDPMQLRVFRRDADGSVTEITGFAVDSGLGRVSFPASHFSVYQVFEALPITRQALTPSSPEAQSGWGYRVAVSGNAAIVGSRGETSTGGLGSAGRAYVFAKSGGTWAEQAVLQPPSPAQFGLFGVSVAIDDTSNLAVVGASGETSTTFRDGRAHVFRRSGSAWTLETTLSPTTSTSLHGYGTSVAVSGDTVAVGNPFWRKSTSDFGAVWVYRFDGSLWNQEARIDSPDAAHIYGSFGRAIALQGNRLVVGDAAGTPGSTPYAGAAYVYQRTGTVWTLAATLANPTDSNPGGSFGEAVSLDGDIAVVGDPEGDHDTSAGVGKAVVYVKSGATWPVDQVFAGATTGARVGVAVGVSGTRIAVAQRVASEGSAGVVTVRERVGLSEYVTRLRRAPSTPGFGESLSLSGPTLLIGASDFLSTTDTGFIEFLGL